MNVGECGTIFVVSLSPLEEAFCLSLWPLIHQAREVDVAICSLEHHFHCLLRTKATMGNFGCVFFQKMKREKSCDLLQSITE